MVTRALRPDEFDVFRSLRLAALATDPDAFASTLDREVAFTDDEWARPLVGHGDRPGAVFVDVVGDEPVGIVGIVGIGGIGGIGDLGPEAVLWGMWVAPHARGTGVGRRLVDSAIGWATSVGATTLQLWVMAANESAIALYRTAGFETVTHGAPPAPPGCHDERFMRRPL